MAAEDQEGRKRRWGNRRALNDGNEATELLLDAAARCIVRRGSARIAMAEVAEEAGVTRSTLYRYFATRDELIVSLLLWRAERLVGGSVAALPDRSSAAASLTRLILHPVQAVRGTPINEALFSPDSEGLVVSIELQSDAIFEIACRHFGPILAEWQASGQLQPDLDPQTTIRWIIALALLLVSAPWRDMSAEEQVAFVDRYVTRALLLR